MTSSSPTLAVAAPPGRTSQFGRGERPRTAWQALTRPPGRFLLSSWPWRGFVYLVSGSALGLVVAVGLFVVVVTGAVLALFMFGLLILAVVPLVGLVVAPIERWRLRLVDEVPIVDPHHPPPRPGPWAWFTHRYREAATWRDLAATLLLTVLGIADMIGLSIAVTLVGVLLTAPLIVLAGQSEGSGTIQMGPDWEIETATEALLLVPVGLVLLVVFAYAVTAWAAGRAQLTRLLLAGRDAEPGERVVALTRSRARLVDAFQAERRRIERDLHDGAQQRLVALTVELGLARLDLPADSDAGRRVASAHDQAKLALGELRELIRGVHPQLLTDRGLAPAVADVASRTSVPVTVEIVTPRRLPREIEAAAYFVVTEALTNVDRHSGAASAIVRGRIDDGRLIVEVIDDGVGGADAARGTGLVGLADRVSVVDGVLTLVSPIGGPTLLRVEIPC
ncbi:sensor histidine kinase [Cryptosporangium aurantiacum]|uniref:histidine kinase n=1 Tax=Cryptosporangium aurantiacum TaxID=134849 RepID=A0A1M7Q6C9_9ACTN|nr:sensor histidine kinase [Cryptosporangium aurantiacum]SHN25845.1 Signal transduction histidine kinase [Cryptosporangium aurantiacum]